MATIKVMTWNVLYKEKADNILALVKEIKPDVLCCQEITTDSHINPGRNVPEEISQTIRGNYRYQKILDKLESQNGSMGNAIISKFPIINSHHFFVQKGSGEIDYSKQNRGYIEASISVNRKLLTVGTTHLSYVDFFIDTPDKDIEADKLIAAIAPNDERFIITGDFNSLPASKTITKLEKLFNNAGPPNSKKTFTTKPFKHNNFVANGLDWRLDYIFATNDIKILSSEIINTEFSDHLPIVAELEV